jgi:hypothetical protein
VMVSITCVGEDSIRVGEYNMCVGEQSMCTFVAMKRKFEQ